MSGPNETVTITVKGIGDFSDVVSNVGSVQKALTKLKLPDKLGNNLNKNITAFMSEYEKYQKKVSEGLKTQGDYNQVEKSLNRMRSLYQEIGRDTQKLTQLDMKDMLNLDTNEFKKISNELTSIIKQIGGMKFDTTPFTKAFADIRKITKSTKVTGDNGILSQMIGNINSGQISEAKKQLQELQTYAKKVAPRTTAEGKQAPGTLSPEKYKQLTAAIEIMNQAFSQSDEAMAPLIQKQNELQQELEETKRKAAQGLKNEFDKYSDAGKDIDSVTESLKRMHQEEFSFNREAQNIDRQIQSYFGLSQMIRKVGDIAKDAFATVKELDKAMTETAVVTNFSVGDMWEMLPTYTAQANQLGSTIKDVYEASTLYYQQGLNTNQAMGLANETLKMARIAGLDAADATNMMTAALRGFNMEINQMSAQKVNDVYSELAAITASDTKEIGSAMERTASIANSANMDFETTSAFLAQMIETTREAPENLGTAMKTIVARFQEMKQDPTKLIDSEGVAMDANKVDTALKSIGVQLMNTKGEFRDLDDVFLDISAKWDSLTQGQQRYIATIAAGSRQQSRFIAMMSNYERTMELVDAANNSAGASQRQFEKTLDSMEAKLNKLKNAWDQFTMGLMNNQILKFGVSALTEGFTIINKLIDALSKLGKPFGLEGLNKSLLTLATTLGMLNLGKKGARGLVMGGAAWFKGEGGFGKNFMAGFSGQAAKAGTADGQAYASKFKAAITKGDFRKAFDLTKQRAGQLKGSKQYENTAGAAFAPFSAKQMTQAIQAQGADSQIANEIRKVFQRAVDMADPEKIGQEAAQKLASGLAEDVISGKDEFANAADTFKFATGVDINELGVNELPIKEVDELSNKFTAAGESLQLFGAALQDTPLAPFGSLLSSIGTLLMAFGSSIVPAVTAAWTAGMTAASTATAAGSTVIVAGLKGIGAAFKKLFLDMGPIGWVILAITALASAFMYLKDKVPTKGNQLNWATDAAAAASEAYDSAKQEASELADAISQIQENDSAFDNLVAGTAEFNEQLVTANEQIMALINKYPMLMEGGYISTDENGLMHISDAGLKAVKEYQSHLKDTASALNMIQTADLNALENQQKASQLRAKVRATEGKETTEAAKKKNEQYKQEAELLEQRADAEVNLARKNAIRTVLNDKELRNADAIASAYANVYDAKRKVAEAEIGSDKNEIRQKYAEAHGYTYDKSNKKITDVEGNEIDYDDKAIKDEVIEHTVLLDFEANASTFEQTLNNVDARFAATLDKTSKSSEHFISDVFANNIDTDEDILKEALSGNSFQAAVNSMTEKEMAAILGINVEAINEENIDAKRDEIVNLLTENATKIAEAQSQSYADLGEMLSRTKGWDTFTAAQKTSNKTIQNEINQLTSEQAHMMSNFGKQLQEGAGTDTMETYIGFMSDLYKEINQTQFGNIDLNNREIQKNLDGTISTVLGGSGTFGKKEVPIAFSPMLQTGTGKPIQLDDNTVNEYINAVLEKAGDNATAADILKIDANPEKFGLDVDKFKVNGYQIKGLIADVGDTAEETGEKMHQIEVDKEAAKEIEEIFKGADLTSAAGRLETYTKLSRSSIDTVHQFGEELLNATESANLLGETFSEFVEGDWLELAENIDDFQNSMGQIDGAGILKAAEQSHSLNTLLEYGEVSATGLAMALQGVEDGKYAVEDVDSSVLQLLSSMNRLKDVTLEAHKIIEGFDPGIDTGEGEDFVIDNAKKAKEYYNNGEWGNEQLQNYIKLAAGEERWAQAIKDNSGNLREAEKDLIKYVDTFSEGFAPAWDQMVNGQGINGKSLAENIASANIDGELKKQFENVKHYIDDEGFLNVDFGDLSTKELEQYYKEAYGVSEEYAKLLVQDLANYDATISATLQKNDLQKTVGSKDFQKANADVNGNLVLSDATLKTFKEADGDLEELARAAGTSADALEQHAFNVLKDDGARRDDYVALTQEYAKIFKTGKGSIQSLFNDKSLQGEGGNLDLSKLVADTQAHGFDQEQSMQAAWSAYQRAQDLQEKTLYDGIELKDNIKSYEEFQQAVNDTLETSKWEAIGEAIAQGIINYIKGEKEEDIDPEKNKDYFNDSSKEGKGEKQEYKYTDWDQANADHEAAKEAAQQKSREFWQSVKEAFSGAGEEGEDPKTAAANQSRERLSEFWQSIIDGFNADTTDPKTEASQKSREQWQSTWQAVKEAFTSGGVEDPKVEAGNRSREIWKGIWANVKKSLSSNPDINPDPKTNGGKTETQSAGKTTVETSEATSKLEELQKKIQEINQLIEQGGTYNLQVTGVNDITKASKAADNLTKKAGTKKIGVSTTFDNSETTAGVASINAMSAKVRVGADLSNAYSEVDSFISSTNGRSATVDVEAHVRKTGISSITIEGKTVSITTAASGMNNHMSFPSFSMFAGSLAKGTKSKYGQVGPQGKGGLTLTGEKGFEIAWLPSTNQSMILGAEGPQMLNLPSDAVVWTHEQSKKILKQKSIPAGSHALTGRRLSGSSGGSSGGGSNSGGGGNGGSGSQATQKAAKNLYDASNLLTRAVVWWENIARRAETIQRATDKNQKTYEKYLKKITSTLKSTGTTGDANSYIGNLNKTIEVYQEELKRANAELQNMDLGTAKQRTAKNQEKLAYYTKQAYMNEVGGAVKVSFKQGDETKEKLVNTAGYIYAKDGTYYINQDALNKVKNLEERKSLKDALEKELNDRISKRNKAEDEIQKAREALEKLGEELYEAFFAWENELTKIWNLTQKIENFGLDASRLDAYTELLSTQLASGLQKATDAFNRETIKAFKKNIDIQLDTITNRQKLINEQAKELNKLLSTDDEQATLNDIRAKINSGKLSATELEGYKAYRTNLKDQIEIIEQAQKYLNIVKNQDNTIEINFKADALEQDRLAGLITADAYKAIDDYVKKLIESNEGLANAYQSLTEDLTKLYDTLTSLRDNYAKTAEDLVSIAESSEDKRLKLLKQLNDSLTKAFKDLIDEVKQRIEDRRRQEDNIKTEQDINKKQQRLAALQADTSGGHQVEIAQLQKEIAEAQQSYQRTLEDQLLDKLQRQGDEAAKQRERQIELQEAIHTAVNNAALVDLWLSDPKKFENEIRQAYYDANDYKDKTTAGKEKIERDFESVLNQINTYKEKEAATLSAISQTSQAVDTIQSSIAKMNVPIPSAPSAPASIPVSESTPTPAAPQPAQAVDTKAQLWERIKAAVAGMPLTASSGPKIPGGKSVAKLYHGNSKMPISPKRWDVSIDANGLIVWHDGQGNVRSYDLDTGQVKIIPFNEALFRQHAGVYKPDPKKDVYDGGKQGNYGSAFFGNTWTEWYEALRQKFPKRYPKAYATGGIADYTGPAWLDGTPSKPELVLNAQDTKNFIALKDILSNAMKSANSINKMGYGETTYEININVDKITQDYDVDKMADRIKKIIVKESNYRNVTQVSRMR